MFKLVFLLLALTCISKADETIGLYVKNVLENLRSEMKVGIPQLGIPVLEPLKADNIDFDFNEGLVNLNLKIQDFYIARLSTFQITKATGNMHNLQVELKFLFDAVSSKGYYNVDGKVLIFPIYGQGDALISVKNLVVDVIASIKLVNADKIQLDNFRMDAKFESFNIYLAGIIGGGQAGELLNSIINSVGKGLFDKFRQPFLVELARVAKLALNSELSRVDLKDIIGGVAAPKPNYRQSS